MLNYRYFDFTRHEWYRFTEASGVARRERRQM